MKGFARLIASGFYCGYIPGPAGTWGSLAALPVGVVLMLLSPFALPVAAAIAALSGVWAITAAGAGDDPGWVVIDEIAGMWITMIPLAHPTAAGLIAAFLLFRLLDITKPGPIGWADRQHVPAGVMADDLIAGAIGAGILWAVQSRWPGVFESLLDRMAL